MKKILSIAGIIMMIFLNGCVAEAQPANPYGRKVKEAIEKVQKNIDTRGISFEVVEEELINLATDYNQYEIKEKFNSKEEGKNLLEQITFSATKKNIVIKYPTLKGTAEQTCPNIQSRNYDEICGNKLFFGTEYREYDGLISQIKYSKKEKVGFRMYVFDMKVSSNIQNIINFNKEHGKNKAEDPGQVDYITLTTKESKYALYYTDNYDVKVEGINHKQFISDVFKGLDLSKM